MFLDSVFDYNQIWCSNVSGFGVRMRPEYTAADTPLIFETEDTLNITKASNDIHRRNSAVRATSESNQLYVKTVAAKDGLSEVAAREMAEILGFGGLIPSNTIAGTDVLHAHEDEPSIPNT